MRRKRTIIASRLGLLLNIIELIGIIAATFVMTAIGLLFKDLVDSFGDGSGLAVFFKIGGISILLALILMSGIIALMVAGKRIRHTADYSAHDYKNKNILYNCYNFFGFVIVGIIIVLALAFLLTQTNIYSILVTIYAVACFALWVAITAMLGADMREAKKIVKSNAISNIDKSNYGQKNNVQAQLAALNNEQSNKNNQTENK